MLALAALVWLSYSIVQVVTKGVALDHFVQQAQIIAGAVHYPAGHPTGVFAFQEYSLLAYLAAGLWAMKPDVSAISAISNVLFMFLSVFVPFSLVLVLTRRPFWGYAASALVLSEAAIRFQGTYPIFVFPTFHSPGHVGSAVAILAVVLLVAGLQTAGGLALGLLPAIHPSMAILVWPWAACYLLVTWRRAQPSSRRRVLIGLVSGVAISALLLIIVTLQRMRYTPTLPYDVQGNAYAIHRLFTQFTEVHNQPYAPISAAYLVNPVGFFAAGAMLLWSLKDRAEALTQQRSRIVYGLLFFGGLVWLYICGSRLYHMLDGSLPYYVALTKPYRFSNMTAILLIPITLAAIATIAGSSKGTASLTIIAMIAFLLLGETLFLRVNRSLVSQDLMFVLWGMLGGVVVSVYRVNVTLLVKSVIACALLFLVATVTFLVRGSFVGIPLAIGFGAAIIALGLGKRFLGCLPPRSQYRWHVAVHLTLVCSCVLAGYAAMRGFRVWDQWLWVSDVSGRYGARWDTVSQNDEALIGWLSDHTGPDDVILSALVPPTALQLKTGHPVFLDSETLYLMDFVPDLAPTIGMMVQDVYGVDYGDESQLKRVAPGGRLAVEDPVWLETWRNRDISEWRALSEKYGFHLVLSPTSSSLRLPIVHGDPVWTLYEIP